MAGEREETTLADVSADVAYGYTESASDKKVGPRFLRITDIQNGVVDWHTVPYCPISDSDHRKYRLHSGDIVVARTGNSTGENYLYRGTEDAVYASYLIRFRVNQRTADPAFVWYNMRTQRWQNFINSSKTGSAQAGANAKVLGLFPLYLPPLAEQKAIAAVLGALDDKIELNRRMNATLEAMARALFQSWFVDFDPVRAKLDGRQPPALDTATADLFPAAFQDSELGPIPKGWSAARVGEVSSRIAMGPFGSRITRDNFVPNGVPVVRGGNLTDGFVDDDFVFLTEGKAEELKASVARPLDIVFTHRGTLGQVGIIPIGARYPRYIVSQSQMLFSVDREKLSPWAAYLFFRSPQGEAALLANTSTTGVPAISRPTTSLKAIQMVVPSRAVSKRFDEVIEPLFLQREQLAHQSRTLATLRDTLLPKLLGGELSAIKS
jgi:type I restriction enzyme S subunit